MIIFQLRKRNNKRSVAGLRPDQLREADSAPQTPYLDGGWFLGNRKGEGGKKRRMGRGRLAAGRDRQVLCSSKNLLKSPDK